MPSRVRYKIILGKFAVRRVIDRGAYLEFAIELPGLGMFIVKGQQADVVEGELLTLYTEVLAREKKTD